MLGVSVLARLLGSFEPDFAAGPLTDDCQFRGTVRPMQLAHLKWFSKPLRATSASMDSVSTTASFEGGYRSPTVFTDNVVPSDRFRTLAKLPRVTAGSGGRSSNR